MKEKVINGIKFSVTPFRSLEGAKLQIYLVDHFGPAIMQLLGIVKDGLPKSGNIFDMKLDGTAASLSIEKLMAKLTEEEFEALLKRLFINVTAYVTKDGTPLQLSFAEQAFETSMDIVFAGKLFSIYPLILFVLEVNYPDFLTGAAQFFGKKIPTMFTSMLAGENSNNESEKSGT